MLLGKQYQYKRIPFGIKPGPKMFQRYIVNVLGDIDNCFVYVDDIVIFSKTEDEHAKTLMKVLSRLFEKGVKINIEKSRFFQREVEILGHIVNEKGYTPKTESVEKTILSKEIRT
ncbi:Retrovirus-related Pol polyprotein from transposon 17.6 [Nosema granulosis]|uniref:Retrovirus-related Pol polyprotein from transposon 17.6 n=1 Tax=Nosema granulosis TaxID=83296 RepID=A0A9P6GWQ0_9MICR|nr:Retrovirus-related Pol polyprotein from transposon 17.6 [Nosema granulosis]